MCTKFSTKSDNLKEQQPCLHNYIQLNRCGKFKANEITFPPTGFRKLPHTIFKTAAVAQRGRADSVIHSIANTRVLVKVKALLVWW